MRQYSCAPGAPITVAGDSISKGVSFDDHRERHVLLKNGFCTEVSRQLRPAVENLSRFGQKSTEVLATLRERLAKKPLPGLVMLEVGGNDCDFDWQAVANNPSYPHQPHTPLPVFEETLLRIVQAVKDAGVQLFLCDLPPIDAGRYFRYFTRGDSEMGARVLEFLGEVGRIYWWHERYSAAVERIAQSTKTPILLLRAAMLQEEDYREFISGDGLHPNARGHARLAQITIDYVKTYAPTLLY